MKPVTLVHCMGRFCNEGWDPVMVGSRERMGQLPITLRVLAEEQHRIRVLSFGTGASHVNGEWEAQRAARVLRDGYREFGSWDRFRCVDGVYSDEVDRIIRTPRMDVRSQNTEQELMFAKEFMLREGLDRFVGVTCPSHLPRCTAVGDKVFSGSGISVLWVPSEAHYLGASPGDAVVFEAPHRSDDPIAAGGYRLNELMARFWMLPNKLQFLQELKVLLECHEANKSS